MLITIHSYLFKRCHFAKVHDLRKQYNADFPQFKYDCKKKVRLPKLTSSKKKEK